MCIHPACHDVAACLRLLVCSGIHLTCHTVFPCTGPVRSHSLLAGLLRFPSYLSSCCCLSYLSWCRPVRSVCWSAQVSILPVAAAACLHGTEPVLSQCLLAGLLRYPSYLSSCCCLHISWYMACPLPLSSPGLLRYGIHLIYPAAATCLPGTGLPLPLSVRCSAQVRIHPTCEAVTSYPPRA
jgi:hypothetical protein